MQADDLPKKGWKFEPITKPFIHYNVADRERWSFPGWQRRYNFLENTSDRYRPDDYAYLSLRVATRYHHGHGLHDRCPRRPAPAIKVHHKAGGSTNDGASAGLATLFFAPIRP